MDINQISYLGIIFSFAVVFIGLVVYYFNNGRKERVEKPKYRIID
ncbi:MAG: CcoQ/FixQ family Cbb3-type cytochrome c oxidase assembly chaperone, partial [Candidatus Schekmanbacteria bacterium]